VVVNLKTAVELSMQTIEVSSTVEIQPAGYPTTKANEEHEGRKIILKTNDLANPILRSPCPSYYYPKTRTNMFVIESTVQAASFRVWAVHRQANLFFPAESGKKRVLL